MQQDLNSILGKIREAQKADVHKAFVQPGTAITGIAEYDLQPAAQLLYPITTIMRNMIPRNVGGTGIQANWRTITAVNPGNVSIGLSEGNRGGYMSQTVNAVLAAFAFLGLDNYVTFEADYAAKGFDDVRALAVTELLQACMEQEEKIIIGGNATMLLGTGVVPTATGHATGGALSDGTTYSFVVVPLTYDGMLQSTVAAGVKLPYTRTNADGSTDTIQGFSGIASTNSTGGTLNAGTAVQSFTLSTTATPGAVGYAWYASATAASWKLAAITGNPTATITALNASGQLSSALPSTDTSTNSLVFDGLLTQAMKSGSGSYTKDLGGAAFTTSGSGTGGIAEIDTALSSFYNNYRLIPTDIIMNGTDQQNAKNKILTGNTNLAPFFMSDASANGLAAAAQFKVYNNPIGFGTQQLQVHAHPFMPQGTCYIYSRTVPYPLSNVAQLVRMLLRRDYYQIEWPIVSRKYQYGVYFDGVLQNYFNPAFGVITGIGNS
jgi:hypothetical protein